MVAQPDNYISVLAYDPIDGTEERAIGTSTFTGDVIISLAPPSSLTGAGSTTLHSYGLSTMGGQQPDAPQAMSTDVGIIKFYLYAAYILDKGVRCDGITVALRGSHVH